MPAQTLIRRVRAILAYGVTLTACALVTQAQAPSPPPTSSNISAQRADRALNVAAVDEKGQPVTDLTRGEFKIFDDGKVQQIESFNPTLTPPSGKVPPPTALLLFDLLNSPISQRDYSSGHIVRALERLERADSVYLYLLANRGDLHAVRGLPNPQQPAVAEGTSQGQAPACAPWPRQVRPLLGQAIQKTYGLWSTDYRDQGNRTAATFLALAELGDQFMRVPGRRTIIWLTQGVPNWLDYPFGCKDVIFPERGASYLAGRCSTDCTSQPSVRACIDYAPFLERFGAKLTRSDTVLDSVEVNTRDSVAPHDRGGPHDTLQKLADLSGGRLYINGEIEKAIVQSLQVEGARYELIYRAPAPDGEYHKLRVECSRKGVHIAAPHGYFSEQARPVSSSE